MKPTRSSTAPSAEARPCIWTQAGVVSRKLCRLDYHCIGCRFDRAMQRAFEGDGKGGPAGETVGASRKRRKIVSWKEKLRALPPARRPCIHTMKGRIDFRACTHDYRCSRCEFDQYFGDQHTVHALVRPVHVSKAHGFEYPQGYYFHRGHTWVRLQEESSVLVGLDAFILNLLGPFDRILGPLMGKAVKQDRPAIEVTRGRHRARVLSPVSGVVTSMHADLADRGDLADQDPYCTGWVMRVQARNLRQDLKGLMISEETGRFIGAQAQRLYELAEEVSGPLAADGGALIKDVFGHMPQLGWERLIRTFLLTAVQG